MSAILIYVTCKDEKEAHNLSTVMSTHTLYSVKV